MNTELFIAKHIIFNKSYSNKISGPVIKIAIAGIALGIAVMIIAVSVVTGFQNEIRNKVIGFGSHIQITHFSLNNSYESLPMPVDSTLKNKIKSIQGVKHVQAFATKAGIIKTKDDFYGIVLKGIGNDFDWTFFRDKIIEGSSFEISDTATSKNTLISKHIADKLKLTTGDNLKVYFIKDNEQLARNLKIKGIYETGLEELDQIYILVDIKHIQRLNNWETNQIGGYEVLLHQGGLFNSTLKNLYLSTGTKLMTLFGASDDDITNLHKDNLDKIGDEVYFAKGYNLDSKTIKQLYAQIFDWLELQNVNVQIIIILMLLVAGINMISALLILILEKTNMIGILKALGAMNSSIRKIFLYKAAYLIIAGLFFGNIIGISLCWLQYHFKWIPLDEQSYFVSSVPIDLNFLHIIILNIGSLLLCMLMLIIPSGIIAKINPVKAIKYN